METDDKTRQEIIKFIKDAMGCEVCIYDTERGKRWIEWLENLK